MKLVLFYWKRLLMFNLPLSVFVALLAMAFPYANFMNSFTAAATVFGFFLSVYIFDTRYKNSYYFFYNKGFSKLKLIVSAFLFNLAIFIPLFILAKYLI